jgi:hypothetical protein
VEGALIRNICVVSVKRHLGGERQGGQKRWSQQEKPQ